MFCPQCGSQNPDGAKFCASCGYNIAEAISLSNQQYDNSFSTDNYETEVNASDTYDYDSKAENTSYSQNSENKDAKKFTLDNATIERYAPIATMIPLLSLLISLLFGILRTIFVKMLHLYPVGKVLYYLGNIFGFVFFIAALAAFAGIIYVAIKKENLESIWTWMVPVSMLFSLIASMQLFIHSPILWLFRILAIATGVEILARVTIKNNPIDTPMDYKEAFSTYKNMFANREPKPKKDVNPTPTSNYSGSQETPYSAQGPAMNTISGDSYFDGTGLELLGYSLLAALVCLITCSLAAPWMICKVYTWRLKHTVINGKRLTFDGSGGSLFGHWILWTFLTIITCGIYGFFMFVAVKKWELSHTYIDGEPVVPGNTVSFFDGNSFEYFGYGLLSGLLISVTCSIATPWAVCMIQKWMTKHEVINGHRLAFDGSGMGFLGEYLIILLLSVITCGIYSPWGVVRMNKYVIRHTYFQN